MQDQDTVERLREATDEINRLQGEIAKIKKRRMNERKLLCDVARSVVELDDHDFLHVSVRISRDTLMTIRRLFRY